jgi:hypothetical protein
MAQIGSRLRTARQLVWHPEEKLWNWGLIRALWRVASGKAGRSVVVALIGVDSLLLTARVWRRRLRFGSVPAAKLGASDGSGPPVLYIDCGVHKRGKQIRRMHDSFGDRYELRVRATATAAADEGAAR